MDSFGGCSITALANLLKSAEEQELDDSEDEKPKAGIGRMGPGDVGGRKRTSSSDDVRKAEEAAKTKDIWSLDEVAQGAEYDDVHDPRLQPEYEMVYKQAVTSEDMFLQMGSKNPSTASCEDLIVKVKLPGSKIADVILDVKESFFDCRTAKYKLGLYLPHRVDAKNAKAAWDSEKELLIVTMRLIRDYDFMNF